MKQQHPSTGRARRRLAAGLLLAPLGIGGAVAAAKQDVWRIHQPARTLSADVDAKKKALDAYGRLPLAFEANQGQTNAAARYLARGKGYTLFLTDREAVLSLRKLQPAGKEAPPRTGRAAPAERPAVLTSVVRMQFAGAQKTAPTALAMLPGKVNYLRGRGSTQWYTNVSRYRQVQYSNLYPGVDLVYYGSRQRLEYDFVVQPGADPDRIRLALSGAEKVELDQSGDLVLTTESGKLRQHKPLVYQEVNGARKEVSGRYVVLAAETPANDPACTTPADAVLVGFKVENYDPKLALVIDPVVSYSTYLGGSGDEDRPDVAFDATGSAYVTGETDAGATSYPTTEGAFQTEISPGECDLVVTKLNPAGTDLVYSTFLGGTGDDEEAAIAVDAQGAAYVTGVSTSIDFPVTEGAFDTSHNGVGSVQFLAAHRPGGPRLTGGVSVNAPDLVVTKLNATGSDLVYSTFLGGFNTESRPDIAVDSEGSAYVTGTTYSFDFPTTANAYDRSLGNNICTAAGPSAACGPAEGPAEGPDHGGVQFAALGDGVPADISVTKFTPDGSDLVYSTYLGGSDLDESSSIALGPGNTALVALDTNSSDYPTTPGALDTTLSAGTFDFAVTQLNAAGSGLVYSTFLGGSGFEANPDIAVDATGAAYIAGSTGERFTKSSEPVYPVTPGAYDTTFDGDDQFFRNVVVSKLNPAGNALVFSTFLGQTNYGTSPRIGIDAATNVYVVFEFGGLLAAGPVPAPAGGVNVVPPVGGVDVAIRKLNLAGTALLLDQTLGGTGDETNPGLAVAPLGTFFVVTESNSTDFPTTPNAFDPTRESGDEDDFTVTRFSELFVEITPPSGPAAPGTLQCFLAEVRDEFGQPVGGVVVSFILSGAGTDDQVSTVTTDESGSAQFCYTPNVSGTATVTVCVDSDNDGVCDPGEAFATVTLVVGTPTSTRGQANGNGKVQANGGQGFFDFGVAVRRDGARPTGYLTFRIPSTGFIGRANRANQITSLVLDKDGIPYRGSIYGKLQTNQYGLVDFRADIQDFRRSGQGRDTFAITIFADADGDGDTEALTFGGPLQPTLGLRNEIVIN